MQFSSLLLASLAAGAYAQVKLTGSSYTGIAVGSPFNISWAGATGPVTLTLKDGPAHVLSTVDVIESGLPFPSGSYLWTPDSSVPMGQLALQINDGSADPNYSVPFTVDGATGAQVTNSPSSSASATGSSSSSSGSSSSSSGSSTASSTATSSTGTSSTGSSTAVTTSSPTSTGSSSSKTSTGSSTGSKTSSASSASTPTSAPSSANEVASPLAMVLLAFAAIMSFN